jgi:hypothetical protein
MTFDERVAKQLRENRSEAYERRASAKYTKYTLGAMQALDEEYTRNSIAEGDRVRAQLANRLDAAFQPTFRYQGSVPLNIHIRFVSDIDLLALRTDFITYDRAGPLGNAYVPSSDATPPAACLARLRSQCEAALRAAFPAANVDTSGSKAISLSGGSLRRKVDVIPSHWHDTANFQKSRREADRGVCILIKDEARTTQNWPFLHIAQIEHKDALTWGGTKKVIRLLKTMKSDSDSTAEIGLSSYEIAGLVWHFENDMLRVTDARELALLWATKWHLNFYSRAKEHTTSLMTPDGSRRVIDTDAKFRALQLLSLEVDQLAEEVAREQRPFSVHTPEVLQKSLQDAYIAPAAR